MKNIRPRHPDPSGEVDELNRRLAEAEETLRSIRLGEVDVILVTAEKGLQLFTLDGAEEAYRMLIESMNEGALLVAGDNTILYANQCFARMIQSPLERVIGSDFHRFLSTEDRATLGSLLEQTLSSGTKTQVLLQVGDGSQMPGNLSIRSLARKGSKNTTYGIVVTDMTDFRRGEDRLRSLTSRVVQVQEAERRHLASELHDTVTQMLCGVLVHSHILADTLPAGNKPAQQEAKKLHEIIRGSIREVERISRNLRPSLLDQLGLVASLHDISTEFAKRTGLTVKIVCAQLAERLPARLELALFRILQETLQNVEKHARARHVTVHLSKAGNLLQLTINDDGIGFDPDHIPARSKGEGGFGLLGIRERAISVGGVLKIQSARRAGTEIDIRILLQPEATTVAKG